MSVANRAEHWCFYFFVGGGGGGGTARVIFGSECVFIFFVLNILIRPSQYKNVVW